MIQHIKELGTAFAKSPTEANNCAMDSLFPFIAEINDLKTIDFAPNTRGEGEALMSKGALDSLCDHFGRMFPLTT